MSLVKVTGTQFIRDTGSMALINTDEVGKNDYISKVRMMKAQRDEINTVKAEIAGIKDDMQEIKQLMLTLLHKEQ